MHRSYRKAVSAFKGCWAFCPVPLSLGLERVKATSEGKLPDEDITRCGYGIEQSVQLGRTVSAELLLGWVLEKWWFFFMRSGVEFWGRSVGRHRGPGRWAMLLDGHSRDGMVEPTVINRRGVYVCGHAKKLTCLQNFKLYLWKGGSGGRFKCRNRHSVSIYRPALNQDVEKFSGWEKQRCL